jgi:choline kinase/phosphatidylglycerophosphate synthase
VVESVSNHVPGLATALPSTAPPRVGVVLAAGRSERLRGLTRNGSKALIRLGGMTLVERAVRGLLSSGVEDVVVVVGHHAGPVGAIVNGLAPGRVRSVYAESWQTGNGASLAAVEPIVAREETFALVTADHVFAEGALENLLGAGTPAVLVDDRPAPAAWEEGTRVAVENGMALAFGKELAAPAVDCGAFVLSPRIFAYQRRSAERGDASLAGAVTALAQTAPLRAIPIAPDTWWHDVDTPADVQTARRLLRRSLGKAADGPVARLLNRPVSTRISMALATIRPSPDLVSLVALVLGVIAAGALAAERGIIGGVLVHLTSLIDGVDGEVARLQLRARPIGAFIDGIVDRLTDAAIVAGLGMWAVQSSSDVLVVCLVVAATAASLLSMASKDRLIALGLRPPREVGPGYALGGRDGRLLLIAVGAVLGQPLVALAAVTMTSSLALFLRTSRALATSGSTQSG